MEPRGARDHPSIEELRHLLIPIGQADRWDHGDLPQAVLNLENQSALARCETLLRLAVVNRRSLDETQATRAVALREILLELLPKDLDHPYCSVLRVLAGLEPGTAGRRREQRLEVAGRVLGGERYALTSRSVRRRVKESCWPWLLDRLIEREVGERKAAEVGGGSWPSVVSAPVLALPLSLLAQETFDPRVQSRRLESKGLVLAADAAAPSPPTTGLMGAARPAAVFVDASDVAVGEALPYLRSTFKGYIREDRLLGPLRLIPAVTAHLALIEQLLARAKGRERREVLEMGSRYAEFAGWVCQDAGYQGAALHWSERATEWAEEAGSHVMVAYVLMRRSNQASDTRDAARVIGLAEAAQSAEGPLPRQVRALALRQEAHGYALKGDEKACHARLDQARDLAALSERDGDEGPGGYCTEGYVELHRAHCWVQLEKPERAIDVFQRELSGWPGLQHRDRGVFLSRMALAHAQADQPEPAAARAHEALRIALTTGSKRITAELTRLYPLLARWRHVPEVAPVHDALTIFFLAGQGTHMPAC